MQSRRLSGSLCVAFGGFVWQRGCACMMIAATTAAGMPHAAHAAMITVAGELTVTSDFGLAFKTGDTFAYSFQIDDQATDTDSGTSVGRFNAAVTAFSMTAGNANTGTWNPAAGTFVVAPVKNFATNSISDQVTVQATGSGFPAINGQAFFDVDLTFGFAGERNFVDAGLGETFAQVVGVSPLDFSTITSSFAEIRDENFSSPSLTLSVVVPEPAGVLLTGMAAVGFGLSTRRSRDRRF